MFVGLTTWLLNQTYLIRSTFSQVELHKEAVYDIIILWKNTAPSLVIECIDTSRVKAALSLFYKTENCEISI